MTERTNMPPLQGSRAKSSVGLSPAIEMSSDGSTRVKMRSDPYTLHLAKLRIRMRVQAVFEEERRGHVLDIKHFEVIDE